MENPTLKNVPFADITSELKNYIVDYVGNKLAPENNQVDVEMIIHVLADEFPEVVLPLAEENFFRGYEQALEDMQSASKEVNLEDAED
tara:strand:+ start:477 stop:740 length:264 start_codon:yes stop_codon:yes gene_type:complete